VFIIHSNLQLKLIRVHEISLVREKKGERRKGGEHLRKDTGLTVISITDIAEGKN